MDELQLLLASATRQIRLANTHANTCLHKVSSSRQWHRNACRVSCSEILTQGTQSSIDSYSIYTCPSSRATLIRVYQYYQKGHPPVSAGFANQDALFLHLRNASIARRGCPHLVCCPYLPSASFPTKLAYSGLTLLLELDSRDVRSSCVLNKTPIPVTRNNTDANSARLSPIG